MHTPRSAPNCSVRIRRMVGFVLAMSLIFVVLGPVWAQVAGDPCARGKDLYRRGEFAAAKTEFTQCLAQNGDQVEILLPLTVMAIRENRLVDGEQFGARAVKVAPNNAEARYWYGRALLGQGKTDAARGQWEHGMQISANHKGILEGLARLAIQEGRPAQAYNLLNQIRQQGVNEPWLHRLLADLASGKGLWDQALQHLQDAMALAGPNTADLLSASELSIMAGQSLLAVDFCRQAVSLEPGEATFGGLGEAYFATENMDSALVYLRLAVADANPDPRFIFNLANALEVSGQTTEADSDFREFLRLRPDDPVGHFNFGIHLEHMGEVQAGIEEVEKALELDPTMLNARIVLAQMRENVGDFAGAMEQVSQLQQLDKENADDLGHWLARLQSAQSVAREAAVQGKVHLLHMVLGNDQTLAKVEQNLAAGADFGAQAVQYSSGPTAKKGGDIGWINPAEMKEPMRSAIMALGLNETSPPVKAGGLNHIFKRVP